ncbi:hypothetical protein LR48_Vigan10g167300 [Vigna angularis]|uniref:Uncharacterized protein n=1 Tax=Phaseolus angularis TaxID=3914 RepID=A0A0L9VL39_PHAAN|nr:hypothetical protein LR48_Vigan10g167300 [Vigna angularis]
MEEERHPKEEEEMFPQAARALHQLQTLESPKTPSSHLPSTSLTSIFQISRCFSFLHATSPSLPPRMHQHSKLPTPSAATRPLSYLHQHITLHFFFIRISLSRDRFFLESVLHHHQPFFITNPSLLFLFVIFRCVHLWRKLLKSSQHAHSSSPWRLVHQLVFRARSSTLQS